MPQALVAVAQAIEHVAGGAVEAAPVEASAGDGGVAVSAAAAPVSDEAAAKKARLEELKRQAAEKAKARKESGS